MKNAQTDELVAACAKLAARAPKVTAYIMVYTTKNGLIHTSRGGSASSQIGLTRVGESNVMNDFKPVKR